MSFNNSTNLLTRNGSSDITWDSSADCHVVPYYVHVIIGIFVGVVAVFTILGNFLVLCTYFRYASLRTSSSFLIINLTVADLLMASVDFPVLAVSSLKGCWTLGYIGCQIYGSTSAIFGLVTINTFAAISLDRYVVIVHRMTRRHRMAKSTTGAIILIIWLLSIVWSVLPLQGLGPYRLEGLGTSCTFNYVDQRSSQRWFFISLVIFNFFIPLLVIIYSYCRIFLAVKSVKKELKLILRAQNYTKRRQLRKTQSEFQTALTVSVIIVIFCIAWTPYVIISFVGLFGPKNIITPLMSLFPNILAKVSTVSNPVLYTIGHPETRKKMMAWLFSRHHSINRSIYTTSVNNSCGQSEV